MKRIGLIAGNRKFPLLFAKAASKRGYSVVAIAIKNDTSFRLSSMVSKVYWLKLSDFSRMFEIFKKEGIKEVVMAGQISPHKLFSRDIQKDKNLTAILSRIKDKKADTIFTAIADKLKEEGIELLSSLTFLEEWLPKKGTLTKTEPGFSVWEDIYFGLELAKAIGYLDIGQTAAVKSKAVVAVEALEGTDNLIRRAGKITGGGFVVVKVSKPRQDVRFDVPVVGLNTVKTLIKSGAKCLAIEADRTVFIDQEKAVMLADKYALSIVAI